MNSTTSKVYALTRSNLGLNTLLMRAKLSNFIQSSSYSSQFVPLYEVPKILCNRNKSPKHSLIPHRCANTSSGNYASSTMPCPDRATNSVQTVFEGSDRLPALPLPNLEETLEKLKRSIAPVVMNTAEFVSTLQLIDEFATSAGPKLDMLLRCKASQTKNWLTHDWWQKEVYLKQRQPLIINSNPAMVYPDLSFAVLNQQCLLKTTALLVSGIIDFKLALLSGYNPEARNSSEEYSLDVNLCYDQYKNIFGSTRLPGDLVDTLKLQENHQVKSDEPFDVVVSYRGRFYQIQLFDVEDEDSRIEKIYTILNKIVLESTLSSDEKHNFSTGAGVLTTAKRNDWSKAYKLLDQDSMQAIQSAQFLVCIDTIAPKEHEDAYAGFSSGTEDQYSSANLLKANPGSQAYYSTLLRQVLHSDSENVGNRWFDKSLQLVVVADDRTEKLLGAGINYEHSLAEASVVTKMIEYSFDKVVQKNRESANSDSFSKQTLSVGGFRGDTKNGLVHFRQLRMFQTDENWNEISEQLRVAKQDFLSLIDQFDLAYLGYRNYGSNAIKSWRFSPDSWFQVAIQLAYFSTHKRVGSCYESASTRRFAYGRTETIRSLTEEVAQFCMNPSYATMKAAIEAHKSYSLDAINGKAIDRALMGYKMTFNELLRNTWKWGVPDAQVLGLSASNASNASKELDLDRLFSDKELSIISAFFNSELIKRSTKFSLSTSQVSSIHPNICVSYGPLLMDGYGCCYNITGQQLTASITANSSNQSFSCDTDKLHDNLKKSLDRMGAIAEHKN